MAFNQDSWTTSYDACETLSREIMEKISYCNQQPKNSVGGSKARSQARRLMKNYSENIAKLKQMLFASRAILTESEFERRQRLIDGLNSKNVQINDAFNGREESGNRQALLGGAGFGLQEANVWDVEENEQTRDLTFEEIKEQQKFAIQEQDKGLDSLYDVVVRQKHMASNIGQELDLQNEMIDDIVDHADNTRERLIKETRHVTIVDRKSGECCYWIIIVVLFIAIAVVAMIPKMKKPL